jgi:23S rRNA pseudouridine2605 synthase
MTESNKLIRLQKFIADCGITSRRKAEELILEGRVMVNNKVADILGTKVDITNDMVTVDGKLIDKDSIDKLYIVLNKPVACVTTVSDPEGRKTVMDLIPGIKQRVYPVGRLDYYSEGLLLMTNDGEFANQIMHPRHEVQKVYEVKVFGIVTDKLLKNLRKGVVVGGQKLVPDSVRIIKLLQEKTWLEFRIHEGKNREIRKICEAHSLVIDKLRRVAIGALTIQGVSPGKYMIYDKKTLTKMIGMKNNVSVNEQINKVLFKSAKKSVKFKSEKFDKAQLRRKRQGDLQLREATDKSYQKHSFKR